MQSLNSMLKNLLIAAGFLATSSAVAQTSVQLFHNSPDPAAAIVKVWVGNQVLDTLRYREATPYITAPALPFTVRITGLAAVDTTNPVHRQTFTAADFPASLGNNIQVVASGFVVPPLPTNPNGISTAFTLKAYQGNALPTTPAGANINVSIVHDSPTAPAVSANTRAGGSVFRNLQYRQQTAYLSLPRTDLTLDILSGNATSNIASVTVPLSGLANIASVTAFASGVLGSTTTPFNIVAVTPAGGVVVLPFTTGPDSAFVQVFHNSPDALTDSVDVYVNDAIFARNFPFRGATGFLRFPGNTTQKVSVTTNNSTSSANAPLEGNLNLAPGSRSFVVVNGVAQTNRYAANPNGTSTGLRFTVTPANAAAANNNSVLMGIVHGSTDAPNVGIRLDPSNAIVIPDTLGYGEVVAQTRFDAQNISFYVNPVRNIVYTGPLSNFGGAAFWVVASGFLNPAANQNGAAFRLLAVTGNGTVIPLPSVTSVNSAANRLSVGNAVLFPNPANGAEVNLAVSLQKEGSFTTEIVDTKGSVISRNVVGNLTSGAQNIAVPVASIAPGVYMLRLMDAEGNAAVWRFTK